jgi:hypothetical protein
MAMRADWQIRPIAEFDAYQAAWDQLNGQCGDLPYLSATSLRIMIKHFGGQQSLAICSGDEGVLAMTVVERARAGSWQTWQPSQAPLGLWLQHADAPIMPLIERLQRRLGGLVLGVTQLDSAIYARPATGTLDYIETACITTGGTFEEYWAERGRNLRQDLPNQIRKLNAANTPPKLTISRDPDCVDQYGQLESRGWKGATALSPDNSQGKFYKDWLPAMQGFAAQYFFGDVLAACDLCVLKNRVLTILKTTHNEAIKGFSPASLLRYELFRQLWPDLHRIEFYGRVSWHTKWTDEVRKMYHVNVFRWAWLARRRGQGGQAAA